MGYVNYFMCKGSCVLRGSHINNLMTKLSELQSVILHTPPSLTLQRFGFQLLIFNFSPSLFTHHFTRKLLPIKLFNLQILPFTILISGLSNCSRRGLYCEFRPKS